MYKIFNSTILALMALFMVSAASAQTLTSNYEAVGFNYSKGDLNLPINIAFVPDKMGPKDSGLADLINSNDYFSNLRMRETGYRSTVSVGFNLVEKKR